MHKHSFNTPKRYFGVLNECWGINGRNKMTIFAAAKFNIMKQQKTIVTILLNILFCAALLWFFPRNAFLRPPLDSQAKEYISGLLLLATLYANYYLFYPKLYRSHTSLYWSSVVIACLVAGSIELALGHTSIAYCCAHGQSHPFGLPSGCRCSCADKRDVRWPDRVHCDRWPPEG